MAHYVKGKEIVEEIRLSKLSYCSTLIKPEHGFFHGPMAGDFPTEEEFEFAAETWGRMAMRAERRRKGPLPAAPRSRLVFRRARRDWIPEDCKPEFPPFEHHVVHGKGTRCVLRSHWKGDLETGGFSDSHGERTARFTEICMLMASRYSSRPNWAWYTWREDAVSSGALALFKSGLKFDEIKAGRHPNPFAYYSMILRNVFIETLNRENRAAAARAAYGAELMAGRDYSPSAKDFIDDQVEKYLVKKDGEREEGPVEFDPAELERDAPLLVGNRRADSLAEASSMTGIPMADLRKALLSGEPVGHLRVAYLDLGR